MTLVTHKAFQMSPSQTSMKEIIFKMRFTSKTIGRHATKSQQQTVIEEREAKAALTQNDMSTARTHAENAIRIREEALNYLKLQAQLEAVANRLQECQVKGEISHGIEHAMRSLDHALGTRDVKTISNVMDTYLKQNEELDLGAKVAESAIAQVHDEGQGVQVNELLQRIADEASLETTQRLQSYSAPVAGHSRRARDDGNEA